MNLEIKSITLGFMEANCYLVKDTESGDTALVDPGFFDETLNCFLKENGVNNLKYILLTHGHFDHIMGVDEVKKRFGGKLVIGKDDSACLHDGVLSLGKSCIGENTLVKSDADIAAKDGELLPFGSESIKVISTPGHSAGSVCYMLCDIIFSGDTVFKGSVGRTDFVNGNYEEMIKSVKKLKALHGEYTIYPGHGAQTTLLQEKLSNPYFNID